MHETEETDQRPSLPALQNIIVSSIRVSSVEL